LQFGHPLQADDLGWAGVEVGAFQQRVFDARRVKNGTLGAIVSIVCMPVDMMTGRPLAAMWRISGRLSASPEPIL
jgi:hypothetical protein